MRRRHSLGASASGTTFSKGHSSKPWIGHGFHSFRNVVPAFGPFEPWHAHNELLQLFYAYGVVGILLFLMVYGSFYLQIRRLRRSFSQGFFLRPSGVHSYTGSRRHGSIRTYAAVLVFFLVSSLMMHLTPLNSTRSS